MPGTNRQFDKWMKLQAFFLSLVCASFRNPRQGEDSLNNSCFLFSYLRCSDFLPFASVCVIK